jgi:serine/threonine protein kinase
VSQDKHRKETDFAYQALESAITGINIKDRKTESQAQCSATDTGAKLAEQIKKLIQDQQAEPELMQKLDEILNTGFGNTQNSMNIRAPASISQNGSTEKKIWLPENMAPELWPHLNITNKLDPPDHRTDLWSVGVLIFRMMAGQLPFAVQEKDTEDVQDFFSREEVLKMQALICNFKEPCPDLLDVMSSSNQNRDRFEDSKVASQNRIFCELIMTFLQKSPKYRPSSALQMKAELKERHLQCEMSATQHDIFISYRQASDSTFAKMVCAAVFSNVSVKCVTLSCYIFQCNSFSHEPARLITLVVFTF